MAIRLISRKRTKCISLALILTIIFVQTESIGSQRTVLDEKFIKFYKPLRLIGLNIVGRTSEIRENINAVRRAGKVQTTMKRSKFFCDSYNGTSKRSSTIPTSIHRLRPGDIDIVGALGDSLTAGNGIFGINLLQISVENRGMVWSIGGQGSWRQYLTLPNILKEFNPNLYGYSTKDGLSTDRSSKFNVAELGAMSRDIPYETKILVQRLKADPMVNFTHHWKLVTIHIGNNDFCSDMCYYRNPENILKWHETNMVKTLRYFRDNVPRLMVNVVPAPNLRLLTKMVAVPLECQTTLRFECPCLIGKQNKTLNFLETIMLKWSKLEKKIAYREEFNSDTFTVNIQPFTQFQELPRKSNGETDFRILSADCFHLSQRGHASCANALWNNMLEAEGKKTIGLVDAFHSFKCPTTERPYISTRKNS